MQDIKDVFQDKEKAGVVLLAAYDTIQHRGQHLKLLRIIPDWHMLSFTEEMLSNLIRPAMASEADSGH